MGDGDDSAFVALEMLFEPRDGLGVEMVGRLVEQEDVGLLQKEPTQRDAAPLAAGENFDEAITFGASQGVHGHLELGVDLPGIDGVELLVDLPLALEQFGHVVFRHFLAEPLVDLLVFLEEVHRLLHALLDDLANGHGIVELRLLFEEADGVAGLQRNLTFVVLVDAGEDAEEGALAGAVETEDADLRTVEVREIDVLEDLLFVVALGDADH